MFQNIGQGNVVVVHGLSDRIPLVGCVLRPYFREEHGVLHHVVDRRQRQHRDKAVVTYHDGPLGIHPHQVGFHHELHDTIPVHLVEELLFFCSRVPYWGFESGARLIHAKRQHGLTVQVQSDEAVDSVERTERPFVLIRPRQSRRHLIRHRVQLKFGKRRYDVCCESTEVVACVSNLRDTVVHMRQVGLCQLHGVGKCLVRHLNVIDALASVKERIWQERAVGAQVVQQLAQGFAQASRHDLLVQKTLGGIQVIVRHLVGDARCERDLLHLKFEGLCLLIRVKAHLSKPVHADDANADDEDEGETQIKGNSSEGIHGRCFECVFQHDVLRDQVDAHESQAIGVHLKHLNIILFAQQLPLPTSSANVKPVIVRRNPRRGSLDQRVVDLRRLLRR
mmetsp:Transcript_1682/g.4557  ORF Transcript_1682/g.4557 Transcript_1682/m.4557 type:complete len:393 (+) Transcript_1682:1081-2259(+)